MDTENNKLPSIVDAIDREILSLLTAARPDWQRLNVDDLSKYRGIALWVLSWSKFIEIRLSVRAWSDATPQVVFAECTVCGRWEKVLPDEIRAAVPAFRGSRVMTQADPTIQYRLTLDGVQAQADAADPVGINRIAVLIASKRMLPGRVVIRITEFGSDDDSDGSIYVQAAAQAAAQASIGDINVNVSPVIKIDAADVVPAPKRHDGQDESSKPEAAGAQEDHRDDYRFSYEPGGHWLIYYEGRKIGMFPDGLGFRYIYELLRHQGKDIPAVRLRDHCRPAPGGSDVTADDLVRDADLREVLGGAEMADERTIRKVREMVDDIEARKAGCDDPHEAAELGEQLDMARQYLASVSDIFGHGRPAPGNPRKNAIDAVRSAIKAAIGKISECDKPCGLHFLQNISFGASPRYCPSPAVDWALS